MIRSKWKGPVVHIKLINIFNFKSNTIIKTKKRNITITYNYINTYINIYTGKIYIKLFITPLMLGYKLGTFIPTTTQYKLNYIKDKKIHGAKS